MFKFHGSGSPGLKVQDYQEQSESLGRCGFKLLGGHVILSDIFSSFVSHNGFDESYTDVGARLARCPDDLRSINASLLPELKVGTPYAVRSSALSERGGTGIYHTDFFVPTGSIEADLENLWEKEREVYASEFSFAAKAWRSKVNGKAGLAIWIAEVVGTEFEDCFLPALSGVAYTSYQGLPTVRVVAGLGTRAVAGGGVVYNGPLKDDLCFSRDLWEQETVDAIQLFTGELKAIDYGQEDFPRLGYEIFDSLFTKLAELKEFGDFYLEWVMTESGLWVVQCAPYQDKPPSNMSIDSEKFFLLAQGHDVFNSGRADCRGVVYVRDWSPIVPQFLKALNDSMSGYLLIITQDAFSVVGGIDFNAGRLTHSPLGFEHFSNAAAVVEKQMHIPEKNRFALLQSGIAAVDHTRSGGQGATHFQQLCSRTDILFVGAEFDISPLLDLPGKMDYQAGIASWDVETKVLVDALKKEGFVYVAKEVKEIAYSPNQVTDLAFAIRKRANELFDRLPEESVHFYNVSYAIGAHKDMNPVGFDPFGLDQGIIDDCGAEGFKKAVEVVLEDAKKAGEDDVVEYLRQLLVRLSSE